MAWWEFCQTQFQAVLVRDVPPLYLLLAPPLLGPRPLPQRPCLERLASTEGIPAPFADSLSDPLVRPEPALETESLEVRALAPALPLGMDLDPPPAQSFSEDQKPRCYLFQKHLK